MSAIFLSAHTYVCIQLYISMFLFSGEVASARVIKVISLDERNIAFNLWDWRNQQGNLHGFNPRYVIDIDAILLLAKETPKTLVDIFDLTYPNLELRAVTMQRCPLMYLHANFITYLLTMEPKEQWDSVTTTLCWNCGLRGHQEHLCIHPNLGWESSILNRYLGDEPGNRNNAGKTSLHNHI
jgi:hypothetical protein